MRLVEVTVKNYRSIGSQTKFDVEDLTTLVGPNNEGKSNLLRALGLGMYLIERWSTLPSNLSAQGELTGSAAAWVLRSTRAYGTSRRQESMGYSWADDYPLGKQARSGTHPTVLRLKFSLNEDEVTEFFNATGIANNGELPIEMSLSRRSASFGVVKPGRGAAKHKMKAQEIAKFIADRLTFVLIPAVRTVEQARGLLSDLTRLRIREIAKSDEYIELTRRLNELRQTAVSEVGSELTTSVSRYLPSVTNVEVVTTDFERSDSVDDVLIDDGSVTSIANKGDGVKSLVTLALIQELAREQSKSHSFILLVDEPEAHLHASAVHELQMLFHELSAKQQVILATHNPIFVNRERIRSNVLVQTNEAKPAKNVNQIRTAIGIESYDNLDSAETVVLLEGLTDQTVITHILGQSRPTIQSDIRTGRVAFKSTNGATRMRSQIIREKSTASRIIAVLDGDQAGQQEAKRLIETKVLPSENIFVIRDTARKYSELEDLFEPSSYVGALSVLFGRNFSPRHFADRSAKWSTNLSRAATSLGIAANAEDLELKAKICVAECLENLDRTHIKESAQDNIEALRTLIWPTAEEAAI
ncbi:ATP-dependent endonuclease [Nesterenkonia sp. Act20]|uniref:ATP-dependent nuclease n=1 Tax=Nesterenkonia sp. Act20 TaxID=1483432 RepID=UPI001C46058E|nr:AAA family ATPase [Nesterenkonia sp. Act20]